MERTSAIVRLLGSLLDGLPVASARPLSALGFVHDVVARVTCPDCWGEVPGRFGCETCRSRGFVEERRRRDPYDTGEHIGALGMTERSREAARARDRELVVLARQLEPPKSEVDVLADANRFGEGWERERARLRAAFDLDAAAHALERLRVVDESSWSAVWRVHVYGWLPNVGSAAVLAARGVSTIDPWLPDPLRAPAAVEVSAEERARVVRDLRIREQFAAGASVAQLAGQFVLSKSQIRRIVGKS